MVLTDRQRADLHAGIYEYLRSRPGEAFQKAAQALAEADPESCHDGFGNGDTSTTNSSNTASSPTSSAAANVRTPLLEKKWTAIPRLQKKVLELERQAAQSAKIHAHRAGGPNAASAAASGGVDGGAVTRRMLPHMPPQHILKGHSLVVTTVALHPVFTIVASGSEDGTIKIWDHESGEYMRTLKGHTNTVNSVAFTPRGTHLASCSTDLSIKLWDVSTYVCLRTLRGHDHTISCVRFLPSLPTAAAAAQPSNHLKATIAASTTVGTTGMDASLAGCRYLLSASRDATVRLWDIETGFCDHTFTDHSDWVRCLAARSADGALWASAGNDQAIYVYDHIKLKCAELRGHDHVIEALAFVTEVLSTSSSGTTSAASSSPSLVPATNNGPAVPAASSGRQPHLDTIRDYLASGSRDRTVRLWSVAQATCLFVFQAHENWVRSVLIHPSGNYILSCSDDKSIRVLDIQAKRCLRTLDKAHNHFITSLDMHPTLPVLVSGSVDQTIQCWLLD